MLTKAKLLRMPAKKYMAKEQLEFFTTQLTEQKSEALGEIEDARQRLRVPTECKDEADRASFEMESQLYLRIVDRKSKLVKKIDFALRRIKTGEYGYCMETGEPIGIERLLIRPTAEFCADIKYINDEYNQNIFGKNGCRFIINGKEQSGKIISISYNGIVKLNTDSKEIKNCNSRKIKILYD